MNTYAIIILSTLVVSYLLELVSTALNLGTLHEKLPDEFTALFDAEAYAKSQQYTRTKSVFGMLTSTINLLIVLVFWFSGGFNALDGIVRSWDFNAIVTGLLYIGIMVLVRSLINLPFGIYATFVIEERFGFNKTTPSTFVKDILKGLALGVAIGGVLLAGVLEIFAVAGAMAWLYCWAVVALFSLLIQFVAPTWIMPLFNKFTLLPDGELNSAILALGEKVKFPLKGIYVMDGSKRSSKTNAFFTGFGKNKRIALFDTLINSHTTGELVSVLAHEIGHYKKKHIFKSMVISMVHLGVTFYLLSIFVSHVGLFEAFAMKNISVYAGLLFFGMLFSPIEMILSIALHAFSRKNEYEADRYAVETTPSRDTMIDALKKLSRENLSHLTPHPFYVWLNYSHPPVLERIRAIRNVKV